RYSERGSWYYEVVEPGFKSNMTDIQAALGIHQLRRLDGFIARRRSIAARYAEAFQDLAEIRLPREAPGRGSTCHLYPIRLELDRLATGRADFIRNLKQAGIGTSVHFIPVHRHPYYRERYGYEPEQFPGAEEFYAGLVSLPLYPKMTDEDVQRVIGAVTAEIRKASRILCAA
ncbi:MAG: DegT/DnrJ/EryC1/StrS family aminotransferase, partial [Bryobacteraceae bacterium]